MPFPDRAYALTPLAATGARFTDFAPYVPSISDAGVVAFEAALGAGRTGVFTSDGQALVDVALGGADGDPVQAFTSHPDLNRAGTLSVYARLAGGAEAVLRVQADGRIETLPAGAALTGIGPLGPTMNEEGDVALRATGAAGQSCVRVWRGSACLPVADAGAPWRGFEGLPVVNAAGQVAFRADTVDGRQGLYLQHGAQLTEVALTGDEFDELARFPILDDAGTVAFVARRRGGGWGVFSGQAGSLSCLLEAGAGFESLRGVLIRNAGPVAFYGTPAGGQLGIYTGTDPQRHRLLGLGDALWGGRVVDFALNPVSVNAQGQLAIRVALDDGRQFIVRADPPA